MNKPIKVLQLQKSHFAFMSALPEEIINALSDDQFDTTAAYLSGSHEKDDMPTVCKKVKCFNLPKKSLKGLRLSAIFQLWKYCKEQQFDVIITHRFKPLYVVLIVNKLLKKPAFCISVLHANNGFDRLYRRLLTRLFTDKYWTYVGVSESVKKNLLQNTISGFTPDNVIFINNSLDIEKTTAGLLPKATAQAKLGVDPGSFVFGTIGRLVNVKGHFYLLDAFKQFVQKNPSAKLIIIGGGALEQQMKNYLQENGLESSVILTGTVIDAYQLLKAFDVFVLSSLSEGLPLVILEAMIASLPIIATDVGGVKDTIADKGKLIPSKSTDAMIAAMQEYIQLDTQQLQSLGKDLRIRAENEFSIVNYRKNYRNLVLQHSCANK